MAAWIVPHGAVQTPVPVDVQHDWLDWTVGLSTVVALLVAVLAIVIALQIDKRTGNRIVTERQRVFELDVLRDLLAAIDDRTALTTDQGVRLSIFGPKEFPVWTTFSFRVGMAGAQAASKVAQQVLIEKFGDRYKTPAGADPAGAMALQDSYTAELRRAIWQEVRDAVDRRTSKAPSKRPS
jgi:hypothetical protein